jgi:hypothetical protein
MMARSIGSIQEPIIATSVGAILDGLRRPYSPPETQIRHDLNLRRLFFDRQRVLLSW